MPGPSENAQRVDFDQLSAAHIGATFAYRYPGQGTVDWVFGRVAWVYVGQNSAVVYAEDRWHPRTEGLGLEIGPHLTSELWIEPSR